MVKGQRTVAIRLGSFALVLAGAFATAYAIGDALPGNQRPNPPSHDHSDSTTVAVPSP